MHAPALAPTGDAIDPSVLALTGDVMNPTVRAPTGDGMLSSVLVPTGDAMVPSVLAHNGEKQAGGNAEQPSQASAEPSYEQPTMDSDIFTEALEAPLPPPPVQGGVETEEAQSGSNEELQANPPRLSSATPDEGLPSDALNPRGYGMLIPLHPQRAPSCPRADWLN